jgi:hypothetical protein
MTVFFNIIMALFKAIQYLNQKISDNKKVMDEQQINII